MTGCIVSAAIPVCVYAVSRIDMDYNSDETVEVFDMISARQRSASKEELESLSSFLHGQYKAPVTAEGYTLIWSDEFDGNSLDTDK